jgi:hypothetical protein
MDSREDSIIELFLRLPTIIDYWLNPDVATFDIYIDPWIELLEWTAD